MKESTWGGEKALSLADVSKRAFLQDGDEVQLVADDGNSEAGFGGVHWQMIARPDSGVKVKEGYAAGVIV